MSDLNLKEYFESVDRGDYQRENFDDFLKKVSFDYKIPSIISLRANFATLIGVEYDVPPTFLSARCFVQVVLLEF